MRKHNTKKRNSGNCFNYGSPDHFSREYKEKREYQSPKNYKVLYKKLVSYMKKQNISLPKVFIAMQVQSKEWVEEMRPLKMKDQMVKDLWLLSMMPQILVSAGVSLILLKL